MTVESGCQKLGCVFLMCYPFDDYCKQIVIMNMKNVNTIRSRATPGYNKLELCSSAGQVIYDAKFKDESYDSIGHFNHSGIPTRHLYSLHVPVFTGSPDLPCRSKPITTKSCITRAPHYIGIPVVAVVFILEVPGPFFISRACRSGS